MAPTRFSLDKELIKNRIITDKLGESEHLMTNNVLGRTDGVGELVDIPISRRNGGSE